MAERHDSGGQIAATRPSAVADAEDVLIRNHDFQWGYDVEVRVVEAEGRGKSGGRAVHEERYYLQPGATRSEFGLLEPGAYDVSVVLDGDRTASARIEVTDAADGVLIELGNGAVSVHDGIYA